MAKYVLIFVWWCLVFFFLKCLIDTFMMIAFQLTWCRTTISSSYILGDSDRTQLVVSMRNSSNRTGHNHYIEQKRPELDSSGYSDATLREYRRLAQHSPTIYPAKWWLIVIKAHLLFCFLRFFWGINKDPCMYRFLYLKILVIPICSVQWFLSLHFP